MEAPKEEPRKRGRTLRVPVLPQELLAQPAEQPPQLPVLSGPASRRRRRRQRNVGAVVWLTVLAAAAVAVVVVLVAKPFSGTQKQRTAPPVRLSKPPAISVKKADTWGPLRAARLHGLPVSVSHAAGVAVGGRIVLVGGRTVLAGPAAGPLRAVAPLPSALSAAAALVSRGSVWIVGGEQGGRPTDEILRIGLRSNRVTPAGSFEEPLAQAGFAARRGSVYLVGGWTGQQYGTAILRYTPPDNVRLIARLPVGLRAPAVALVRNRLYVAGGFAASGPTRTVLTVDLQTGSVRRLGKLPQAEFGGSLVPAGSTLYLFGGLSARHVPATAVLRIDPSSGHVTIVGKTSVNLAGATVVNVGKTAFVFAGRSSYRLG